MIKSTFIPYDHNDTQFEGFCAYSSEEKRPLVILCHAWRGRDEFICEKAKHLAALGYVVFALDMYGKGVIGNSQEENAKLKKPLIEDRLLLQKRVLKGYETACSLPLADTSKITVVGFGFGGLCALDLARAGVDLNGAVSIYGHFEFPTQCITYPIKAKILVLHGYNDPISPLSELTKFQLEMNESNVDWQTHLFGNSFHAFANPAANDLHNGIYYNSISAARAWKAVENFLEITSHS